MKKYIFTEEQIKKVIDGMINEDLDFHSLREDENLEGLRKAIDANRLITVLFVKKDGSLKQMLIKKNLSSYVRSENPKTELQQDVFKNNNLRAVIDMSAYKRELKDMRAANPEMGEDEVKRMASEKAWRRISLPNVLGFLVGGKFIDLRDENQIMERFGEGIYNSLTPSMIRAVEQQGGENQEDIDEIDLKGDKFGGNVALRKLSYRSKWDFNSKHQGLSIEDVMKFFPKSLYWAYTHLEKISFVDEVLDELAKKFPKTFRRIDKPGIDKEQYGEYTQHQNPYAKFSYPELNDMLKAKVLNNEKIDGFFYREYKNKKYEFQRGQFKAHSGRDEMSAGKMSIANQGHTKIDTLKPKK